MRHRNNRKRFLIYPEDQPKVFWDLFITLILLISCLLTPFNLAFGELNNDPIEWIIINYTIDTCFLIDIFIIFNSAFYDSEFIVVEDRKIIAKEYLRSWFIIDLLAIIPFDLLISTQDQNYGDIARIVRLGRISKLIKMTRLLRILKIVKERSKLLKYLNEILKIGLGFERLFFFIVVFIILAHIVSCIWVISAQFSGLIDENSAELSYVDTWMEAEDISSLDTWSLYCTSFYYTISTITTVGYGDLHAVNVLERLISIMIMIIGVISFSFATGSLSSILQNYD
jgi:potassium voltage-gated channel Eag-related subfamily H member 8